MSFAVPIAILLLLPLCGLLVFARSGVPGQVGRLPGMWHQVVASYLSGYVAGKSELSRAGVPILCFTVAALVIFALARPGLDHDATEKYATLAGRVIILDVGSDLSRHRHFFDDLHRADPGIATAVIASSGDAYRIVPFSTDKSQIDRYVRVLDADMMPKPGHVPHVALAQAERILADAGYLVRQIVLVTARRAPENSTGIPVGQARRLVVPLQNAETWKEWASAQGAETLTSEAVVQVAEALREDTFAAARSELPSARTEFTTWLVGFAALLWLMMFRRRAA